MDDEGPKLTFLDRAIGVISPRHALERGLAREALYHFASGSGARPRGRNASAFEQGSSESWQKQRKRIDAIWEARAMEEHFCIIAGVLDRLAMYVVGQIEYQPATGNSKADQEYREYFHDWCGRADITGRFRLREMVELAFRGMVREGEHGFIEHIVGDELRLQAIEADRIGNPNSPNQDEDNIGGIKIDSKGRIQHYEIYKRKRSNTTYEKEGDITPANFIHLYRPTRADQYHGVSLLAPVLPHARDLYELFGFEKVAAKFAASWAGFIRTKHPYSKDGIGWDGNSKNPNNPTMSARPGVVARVDTDEDVQFAPGVTRPSGAFMNLVEAIIREIAIGLNQPYGFVYNMASFGGVTARLELQQAQRSFKRFQELLVQRVLERIKNKVLMLAIAHRKLKAVKNWKKGTWQFGAGITGDIGHQTQADATLIQFGTKTRTAWAAELGGDFNANVDTTAGELEKLIQVSQQKGIPLELLLTQLPNPTELMANFARAQRGESDVPPPPPGVFGQIGDKGAKQVIELLGSVGRGEIEIASARNTLVTVYGMDPSDAMAVLPG